MRSVCLSILLSGSLLSACGSVPDDSSTADPLEATKQTQQPLILATYTGFAWSQWATGDHQLGADWAANGFYDGIFVDHYATGKYWVTFNDVSSYSGNAQVAGYDDNANRCKVVDWYLENGNLKIQVYCHTPSGSLVNNRFVVWYSKDFVPGTGTTASAYIRSSYADRSHTPSSSWSWNSAGGSNYVTRDSTGFYTVAFSSLNAGNGNALVTAFGTGSEYCKLQTWSLSGTTTNVQVVCYNSSGQLADSRFSLVFTGKLDSGAAGGYAHWDRGFVWANQETSSSYTPNTTYNWNPITNSSSSNTAGRTSTGRYWVQYPSFPGVHATNAMVSAYGPYQDAVYCKPLSWDASGNGARLQVNCYGPSGNLVNSKFSAAYTYDEPDLPCDFFCNGVCCA